MTLLGDIARENCEECGEGPVVFTRKILTDPAMAPHVLGPADTPVVWKCQPCGHEQGDSFQPDLTQ
jgi:hypothetical protein